MQIQICQQKMILQQSIINYDFVFFLCSCKNNVLLIEMADSGEEIAREELLFSAVGEGNTGKFENEHDGIEFHSCFSASLIPSRTVSMGMRHTATGNSVTIGQKVTIKCGRKKEDFYFIGAYYNEEMVEYRREDNSSLAIFLGSLQSGVQGNRKKLRDMRTFQHMIASNCNVPKMRALPPTDPRYSSASDDEYV